jgi:hypothetical protein
MSSSTSNSRGEAKKAVRQLLVFLFFLFVFDRLLFIAVRRAESLFYRSVLSSSLQDKFSAVQNKKEYQVLILGTSRTFEGIHPAYIRNEFGIRAFKEAFVGKGPMYNYFFYQEYKKYMGIPRVVIYGVDYFQFTITSERRWMKRFAADLVDAGYFKGGVSLLLANKPRIDEFSNSVLNNLKKNMAGDPNYLLESDPTRMENYRGMVSPDTIDSSEPVHFHREGFSRYPGQEGEYFERLLEQLERDGVRVLLVALPEYIGTFWTNRRQKKFARVFRKFARTRKGVFFYNYNLPDKFDLSRTDFFLDGGYGKTNSHLSSAGAEVLNRMLVRDLRRYLAKK